MKRTIKKAEFKKLTDTGRFIDYPKEYENVFHTDQKDKLHDINKFRTDIPGYDFTEYRENLENLLRSSSLNNFNELVKMEWLKRHLYVDTGAQRCEVLKQNRGAFNYLCQRYIGVSHVAALQSWNTIKVESYMNEFFPNFYSNNPFTSPDKYKYPFEWITIDYLMVVYQMPSRMSLLKLAEERRMLFVDFMDYVINYVHVFNSRHHNEGINTYAIQAATNGDPFYVMYKDFDGGRQKMPKDKTGENKYL